MGVAFAIVLMFLQLGFLGAVGDTATNVYGRMNCDLVIRSPEYLQVFDPRAISADLLPIVSGIPEVLDTRPIDLGVTRWQNPVSGEMRVVAMIGVEPERPAIELAELQRLSPLLRRPDHVLVDSATRADYGPRNGVSFGTEDIGAETEVTGQRVVMAGIFKMGTGLAANGAILVSRHGFNQLAPDRIALPTHNERISMLAVQLRKGVSASDGQASIRKYLKQLDGPLSSAQVLTLDEAKQAERWHWYVRTPIGIIFGIGVALAVIVGGVICYMVLAADVIAKLPEYATLKALGYSNAYLIKVLLGQAAWLASAAFPPAVIASLLLYWVTSIYSGVPIRMTNDRLVFVAVLSFLMCGIAGWIALRKMTKAEPANLF